MFKTQSEPTELSIVIDYVLAEMKNHAPESEEFAKMADQLQKLYPLTDHDKVDSKVSLETLVPVIGNLAGILAILNFERVGVVTSKALGFVLKSRV